MVKSDILISVEPEYLINILAGTKTVELRRRALRIPHGSRIWLYCKAPVASILAVCYLELSETLPINDLWSQYGSKIAISREDFDAYLDGKQEGTALVLTAIRSLDEPVELATARSLRLNFHPPQFFMHLRAGCDLKEYLMQVAA